jgi:hypothetical protein
MQMKCSRQGPFSCRVMSQEFASVYNGSKIVEASRHDMQGDMAASDEPTATILTGAAPPMSRRLLAWRRSTRWPIYALARGRPASRRIPSSPPGCCPALPALAVSAVTMAIDTTASCDAGRLAELLARHEISPGARYEIEQHIDWYLSERSWRGQGACIEIPPEFDKMRKAAVALASDLRRVSIVRAVPDHLKRAHGDRDHFKLVGIDCVASIFFEAKLIDAPAVFPDEQAIQDRLERMLADLDDFANRLAAAQRHGKHRGRKTDRPQHFVRMVASVIEIDRGQPITRSTKNPLFRLLELLKGIADIVGIGPGTVDEAVKKRLKAHSQRRRGEIKR